MSKTHARTDTHAYTQKKNEKKTTTQIRPYFTFARHNIPTQGRGRARTHTHTLLKWI